jgi:ABC-type Co2+ transport system permease subunit
MAAVVIFIAILLGSQPVLRSDPGRFLLKTSIQRHVIISSAGAWATVDLVEAGIMEITTGVCLPLGHQVTRVVQVRIQTARLEHKLVVATQ